MYFVAFLKSLSIYCTKVLLLTNLLPYFATLQDEKKNYEVSFRNKRETFFIQYFSDFFHSVNSVLNPNTHYLSQVYVFCQILLIFIRFVVW